jgi:hypothetical protein
MFVLFLTFASMSITLTNMTLFQDLTSLLQATLKNLSSANPTKVNNVPIGENKYHLEHGDVITTGER